LKIPVRAVVQRVSQASVSVEGCKVAEIGRGLLVLLGVAEDDADGDARYLAGKVAGLRIFDDSEGKLNLSVTDCVGSVLLVSQFTLYGDCRKGRRPSFTRAAPPEAAERLYEAVADRLRGMGIPLQTGRFRAGMSVALINDGPVTLLLDSRNAF
jgi:D-tyrosyl-tRNA(Tyr) deacylase